MKRLGLAPRVIVAATALLAVACGGGGPSRLDVRIAGVSVNAEIARTPEERAQGLGERDALARDAGMLFIFADPRQPSFWMRGMRFPLDMVWISADRHVIALTENAPAPAPGTPDGELPRYQSNAPVLYVLEVNAGVVRQDGIAVGDSVSFDPEPPVGED